jgi:hypothetical protein
MKIDIPIRVIKELGTGDDAPHPIFSDILPSWNSDDIDTQSLQTSHFSEEQLDAVEQFLIKDLDVDKTTLSGVRTRSSHEDWVKIYKRTLNKFKRRKGLMDSAGNKTFRSLSGIPALFEGYLMNLPNHRFYQLDDYDRLIGWVVTNCEHHKATRDGTPAHVQFQFKAFKNGDTITSGFSVQMEDVGDGLKISELLEQYKFFPENDELNEQYEQLILKMGNQIEQKGGVFLGEGVCEKVRKTRWGNSTSQYYFKGDQNKVVMDHMGPAEEQDSAPKNMDSVYQTTLSKITMSSVQLPVHPFVNVFHLDEHIWLACHVDALTPYEFMGEKLMDKLVLPKSHKTLVKMLMNMSKMEIEDIIAGKKGGSFIMATGDPGTGKTLTAEVLSEAVKKPLYKVQCSQLGLDVETVEEKLKFVLNRASRWGSILLMDEADVYVRARGTDINQNAIVGVFLRTLEYYSGILFMTSNMETQIDDAIMSRATAHLQYDKPTKSNLRKIWEILSNQLGIDLSKNDIDELIESYPNLVGRDVKALLKLAKMYSTDMGEPCNFDLIQTISGFVPNVNKHRI